ncbi:MAG: hypothetical protein H0W40_04260 [Methylibium sp.]|uniref:hypothetical protein n=1 Tax=Methylibium sp. TaxID=2067992 RepID=UPI0017E01FE4|nr:hypothetical protein [Methylibium sp.]MBA3596575.1 hypothetical protein [Methylibium sp.]
MSKPWRHKLASISQGLRRLLAPARTRIEWCLPWRRPQAASDIAMRVCVTLTSYPPRFPTLALTLKTLLNQSTRADEVVLWLYAPHAALLPRSVTCLQARGLRIALCDDDWRVYKKAIPALMSDPAAVWVTADDDVCYPRDWLASLLAGHRAHPSAVICQRAHLVQFDEAGRPRRYHVWPKQTERTGPDAPLFFTGIGGVLYPPGCLHSDATDDARFLCLSPDADDIWLNWMVRMQGTPIVRVGATSEPVTWLGSQKASLFKSNARGSGNDECIARMGAAYGFACLHVAVDPCRQAEPLHLPDQRLLQGGGSWEEALSEDAAAFRDGVAKLSPAALGAQTGA